MTYLSTTGVLHDAEDSPFSMSLSMKKNAEINPEINPTISPILTYSPLILLLIDSVDVFGRAVAPARIAYISCSVLPVAKLSAWLVPGQLVQFVDSQCASQISEPGISIIALMLKLTFAVVVALLGVSLNIYDYEKGSRRIFRAFDQEGGLVAYAKDKGVTLFGLFLFCLYFRTEFDKPITHFRIDVLRKFEEDFMCCIVCTTLLAILSAGYFAFLYAFRRRKK